MDKNVNYTEIRPRFRAQPASARIYTQIHRRRNVSRRTVEWLIEQGELATVGMGKLKRVPYDSIVAYQNRHRNDEAA